MRACFLVTHGIGCQHIKTARSQPYNRGSFVGWQFLHRVNKFPEVTSIHVSSSIEFDGSFRDPSQISTNIDHSAIGSNSTSCWGILMNRSRGRHIQSHSHEKQGLLRSKNDCGNQLCAQDTLCHTERKKALLRSLSCIRIEPRGRRPNQE